MGRIRVLPVALVLVAACSGPSGPAHLSGRLMHTSNIFSGPGTLKGRVKAVREADRRTVVVTTDGAGRFTMTLPVGRYRLSVPGSDSCGTWYSGSVDVDPNILQDPSKTGEPRPIAVHAGRTTHQDVICLEV